MIPLCKWCCTPRLHKYQSDCINDFVDDANAADETIAKLRAERDRLRAALVETEKLVGDGDITANDALWRVKLLARAALAESEAPGVCQRCTCSRRFGHFSHCALAESEGRDE